MTTKSAPATGSAMNAKLIGKSLYTCCAQSRFTDARFRYGRLHAATVKPFEALSLVIFACQSGSAIAAEPLFMTQSPALAPAFVSKSPESGHRQYKRAAGSALKMAPAGGAGVGFQSRAVP